MELMDLTVRVTEERRPGVRSEEGEASRGALVLPGDQISTDAQGFMRGHGTYVSEEDGRLVASVAGVVERVNKLISVRPLRSRYTGDVGDVVVGRVVEVAQNKWKVDVNGRQDASLQLGAVSLPGSARRRTIEDQLQMRTVFVENDVIIAEIQSFYSDGSIALQVRSAGKMEDGVLVTVPWVLVKRAKSQYYSLPCGVDAAVGVNGYIWLCPGLSEEEKDQRAMKGKDFVPRPVTGETREKVARVRNCLLALAAKFLPIHVESIMAVYKLALKFHCRDLLKPDVITAVTKTLYS